MPGSRDNPISMGKRLIPPEPSDVQEIALREALDGVTYQTLPEPADPAYAFRNDDAYTGGDKYPNSGYTRVTVSPTGIKVEYVRMWLPADEGPGKVSGTVAFSYSLP